MSHEINRNCPPLKTEVEIATEALDAENEILSSEIVELKARIAELEKEIERIGLIKASENWEHLCTQLSAAEERGAREMAQVAELYWIGDQEIDALRSVEKLMKLWKESKAK